MIANEVEFKITSKYIFNFELVGKQMSLLEKE
jgi:hypothetical protein